MTEQTGQTVGPARHAARGTPGRIPWLVLIVIALGVAMDALDATVVSVANPSIAVDLHTTLPELQWVTNGYLLATAVFLITAGKFGDRFGHKRVFLIGLVGFVASSVLAGLSAAALPLVVARVLQGTCGATLMPAAMAILATSFPETKRKIAFGIFMGTFALAGASGPFIGGLVVQGAGWRWVFFLNVILGAVAFAAGVLAIPRAPAPGASRPFDLPGVALLALALLAVVLGVVEAPGHGWASPYPLACFAIGVAAAVSFVFRERAADGPLIPLSLFRSPPIIAGTLATLVAGGLMFGSWFYLSLYLQQIRALSPLAAGLALIPASGLFLVAAPIGGALNQRLGPRVPIIGGLALICVAAAGLSRLDPQTSYNAIWPFLASLGLGVGFVAPNSAELIVGNAPKSLAGVASGLGQTALMGGSVVAVAALGTLVSFRAAATLPAHLATAGVPPAIADAVRAGAASIDQGTVPVPAGVSAQLARAVVTAGHAAFADGFRLALLAGAVVALASLLLAPLVRPGTADHSN